MMLETKRTLNHDTIEAVKDLISINVDSAKGFAEVAKEVDDPQLAEFFRESGARRQEFAGELRRVLAGAGEEKVDTDGTIRGKFHRWWIDARSLIDDSPHALLSEAERGEDAIKAKYESVLKDIPGTAISDVLHAQYRWVKGTHDRVRALRDAAAS
jgi:uncharacterized protein (TIGR02284 family)